MRSRLSTMFTVIGATLVLLVAGNGVALAATGHGFRLGKVNTANRITTLKRTTSGTALNVRTRRSYNPPLATNGRGRVANLNADMVDGLHANSLKTKSYVFTTDVTPTDSVDLTIPVPAGNYLISYSAFLFGGANTVATCYVRRDGTSPSYFAESRFNAGPNDPGLTGSGFASLPAGVTASLNCSVSSGSFDTTTSRPIQIVATRVDSVTTGTIAPRHIPNARVAVSPK